MRFCLTNYTQCFVIDSAIIFNVLIYEVDLDSSTLLMGNLMRHFLKIFVGIELSLLSSVSTHNMWSYYDWVVVVVVRQ